MTSQSDHTEYPLKHKVTQNYPCYILERSYAKLHCDENELKKHLVRVLKYNKTDASTLTQQIVTFLSREGNRPFQLTKWDIPAELFRVIIQCISPAQRYELLSERTLYGLGVTLLSQYIRWKRDDIVEIILDSINEDECYNLLKLSDFSDWSQPLESACESGNTELVMIMRRHVSKDNWYKLLQQSSFFCSPLQSAVSGGHIDIVKYIQASVTAEQWYELLQIKNVHKFTALNTAASEGHADVIDFIRDTLLTVKWMNLLTVPSPPQWTYGMVPLPNYTKRIEDFVRIETKVQLATNASAEQGKHKLDFSLLKFSKFFDKNDKNNSQQCISS